MIDLKARSKFLPDARLTVKGKSVAGADVGSLSGYLAVYDVVDADGEAFAPGCFAESIAERVRPGLVPLMSKHFRDGGDADDCIGTIRNAREDSFGLFIDNAEFSSDPEAQNIRIRCAENHIKGLSVGFKPLAYTSRPPRDENEKALCARNGKFEVIVWTRCILLEGTVTVKPANEEATITSAKSFHDSAGAGVSDELKDRQWKRKHEMELLGVYGEKAQNRARRTERRLDAAKLGV